jgi:hypothetical protein
MQKLVVVRLLGVRMRVRLVGVVSFMLWSIPSYSDRLLVYVQRQAAFVALLWLGHHR